MENMKNIDKVSTRAGAVKALENIHIMFSGKASPAESEPVVRMGREDFARKSNSFGAILINDSYAKFRFSKRSNDLLSPLSREKFGYSLSIAPAAKNSALKSSQSVVRRSTKLSLRSNDFASPLDYSSH